jgi:phosphoribosylanthranilate isomerase
MKYFFEGDAENVRVKICGITNQLDAEAAIEAGADALGFNFYRAGKRYIDLDHERGWIDQLPPEIARVAVVVDLSEKEATRLLEEDLFDALQLHGDESPAYSASLAKLKKPIIKALRVRGEIDLQRGKSFPVFGLLFDSYCENEMGGTGRSFDWGILTQIKCELPIILAGGLTPGNVAEAVRIVRPHAVDVASGVESDPRRKDRTKMKNFVEAVKGAFK